MEAKKETEADIYSFNCGPSSPSSPIHSKSDDGLDQTDRAVQPPIKFNKLDRYYNMTGAKRVIIINHQKFEKSVHFYQTQPTERRGTEHDLKNLEITFENLGFEKTVFTDLRHSDIFRELSEVCKEDHKATSCIAVVILTHGDEDGYLFAADQPYKLKDIINILQNGDAGLVGKPKLLFVQACRGMSQDDGKRVATDGAGTVESIVLPTHSDMLITLSSAESYKAYRELDTGSWLMQSLCSIFDEYHQDHDLLQLLTFVNQDVANKATFTYDPKTNNKKMIPETKFTLTKLLYF